jgi:hypothetical protein
MNVLGIDLKLKTNDNIIHYYIASHNSANSYLIFSSICMLCRSLFVLLSFFFWPLCVLFFFNLRILITFLVSCSNPTHG